MESRAKLRDGVRIHRPQQVAIRGLHLLVLSAFAVAQPLFDLLGDTPEFFVVRGSTTWDIVAFAPRAPAHPARAPARDRGARRALPPEDPDRAPPRLLRRARRARRAPGAEARRRPLALALVPRRRRGGSGTCGRVCAPEGRPDLPDRARPRAARLSRPLPRQLAAREALPRVRGPRERGHEHHRDGAGRPHRLRRAARELPHGRPRRDRRGALPELRLARRRRNLVSQRDHGARAHDRGRPGDPDGQEPAARPAAALLRPSGQRLHVPGRRRRVRDARLRAGHAALPQRPVPAHARLVLGADELAERGPRGRLRPRRPAGRDLEPAPLGHRDVAGLRQVARGGRAGREAARRAQRRGHRPGRRPPALAGPALPDGAVRRVGRPREGPDPLLRALDAAALAVALPPVRAPVRRRARDRRARRRPVGRQRLPRPAGLAAPPAPDRARRPPARGAARPPQGVGSLRALADRRHRRPRGQLQAERPAPRRHADEHRGHRERPALREAPRRAERDDRRPGRADDGHPPDDRGRARRAAALRGGRRVDVRPVERPLGGRGPPAHRRPGHRVRGRRDRDAQRDDHPQAASLRRAQPGRALRVRARRGARRRGARHASLGGRDRPQGDDRRRAAAAHGRSRLGARSGAHLRRTLRRGCGRGDPPRRRGERDDRGRRPELRVERVDRLLLLRARGGLPGRAERRADLRGHGEGRRAGAPAARRDRRAARVHARRLRDRGVRGRADSDRARNRGPGRGLVLRARRGALRRLGRRRGDEDARRPGARLRRRRARPLRDARGRTRRPRQALPGPRPLRLRVRPAARPDRRRRGRPAALLRDPRLGPPPSSTYANGFPWR